MEKPWDRNDLEKEEIIVSMFLAISPNTKGEGNKLFLFFFI